MFEAQNLRLTKQRQIILDELRKVISHPTADEIYQMVRKRMPKISLGTVYRNLEIMSDCGIIQKLDVGGTQKRFDGTVENHYHIRCVECNKVADIEMKPNHKVDSEAQKMTSFEVLRHRLEFMGICPGCKGTGNNKGRKNKAS